MGSNSSNLNVTRNSRFSYKGSEQSHNTTAKKPQLGASTINDTINDSVSGRPIEKLDRVDQVSKYDFSDQAIKYGGAQKPLRNSA